MLERRDEEALKVASVLHRQWGLRFTILGKYAAAIEAYSRALEEGGEHLGTLLGMCQALLNVGKFEEANRISERCHQIDPTNYDTKWMRVETLYQIGEFDSSLVHAHRGYGEVGRRYRFEDGIYRAREALENCIGVNTSDRVMVELIPWMRKLELHREILKDKLSGEGEEFEGFAEDVTKFRVNDPKYKREYRLEKFRRMLTKKYQGSLADDAFFLEKFFANPVLNSAKGKGSSNLAVLLAFIQDHLTRTNQMTEVGRQLKPLYVLSFKWREVTRGHLRSMEQQVEEKKLRMNNIVVEVNGILARLSRARALKNYRLFFNYVERAKHKLDSYPISLLPEKSAYLTELYNMVGRAYIDPRDVTRIKNYTMRERYLKHHLGIREALLPRDEELAWITFGPVKNSKLKALRKRLALTSQPLELAWLYHELSKLHVEIKSLDLARFYAKKSRDWSFKADNDWWGINANHLLIRIEIHHHNRNEAKEAGIQCLLGAQKIGLDYLCDFYTRILNFIDEIDLEKMKGLDAIDAREKLISKLMPTAKLKCEIDFLFQRMNVVPAKRRLSIVPGCKTVDKKFKLACKRNTIRVKPAVNMMKEKQRSLLRQYAPTRKIAGWMDFEDYR